VARPDSIDRRQPPSRPARPAARSASERTVTEAAAAPVAASTRGSEPSPTPASEIGVVDLRRQWPEVLAKVQRRRRTTQILLESATVVALESGVLRLSMPSAALARRVLEPANADVLRAGLNDALGVDWRIQCEAESEGGTRPSGRAGPPERRAAPADPWEGVPPPEPPTDGSVDEIPDDYGEPADAAAGSTGPRDPEAMALELLSAQLGARPLDQS
jgi:DNA polymerase-3 subunit gamma/tau